MSIIAEQYEFFFFFGGYCQILVGGPPGLIAIHFVARVSGGAQRVKVRNGSKSVKYSFLVISTDNSTTSLQ